MRGPGIPCAERARSWWRCEQRVRVERDGDAAAASSTDARLIGRSVIPLSAPAGGAISRLCSMIRGGGPVAPVMPSPARGHEIQIEEQATQERMHRLPPHPAVQTAVVGGIDPELGIEIDPVAGAFDAPGELRVLVAGQLGGRSPRWSRGPGDAPGDSIRSPPAPRGGVRRAGRGQTRGSSDGRRLWIAWVHRGHGSPSAGSRRSK